MHIPRILVTRNRNKKEEWRRIIAALPSDNGFALDGFEVDLCLLEVQSLDLAEVVAMKARHAAQIMGRPALVDDSSFGLDELGGFPGALFRHAFECLGLWGLLRLADGTSFRRATASTAIAFASDDDNRVVHVVRADVHGYVSHVRRGTNGFDFDPIFIPDGQEGPPRTYAEMSSREKDRFSMRRLAIEKLLRHEWQTLRTPRVRLAA